MPRSSGFDRAAPAAPLASGLSLMALAARVAEPAAEFGRLLRDPVYWGWGVPRGDGHSVLVLPGLGAGDDYLQPLRSWLRRVGYTPVRSGLTRNPGWSEELVARLGELAEQEFLRSGRRLTIIGHSMGGVLGRSVAARGPQVIRQVVTLGSPLLMSRSRLPESVRLTALFSRDDRIVRYPGGRAHDAHARNIEVPGSHTGLAVNPAVYRALARLLPSTAVESAERSTAAAML